MSTVHVALQIAARAPDFHPFIVASRVAKEGGPEEASIVALLHDALEDGYAQDREIWENFSVRIYNAVLTLTRREDETYSEYILRVRESEDPLALQVKRADAEENLDRCLADGDVKRARRYAYALEQLGA